MLSRMLTRPLRRPLLTLALLAAPLLFTAPAAAVPTFGGAFDVSDQPGQLAVGADGNAWVLLPDISDIARITPQGVVTEFAPAALNNPTGITAGPDGKLWVTQQAEVVEIPPADPDSAVAHAVTDLTQAQGITAGPDGALWAPTVDALIKIPSANPAGATTLPILGLSPRSISADAGGDLWIADFGNQRIVRSSPLGATTDFAISGSPQGVASGVAGQVAFAQADVAPHTVGRVLPGGTVSETPAPGKDPFSIALGRDNNWYVAEFTGNLGRLTPEGAYTSLDLLPANSGARYVATGSDGTAWVALQNDNKVGLITGIDPPTPPPGKARIDKAPKKKVKTKRKKAKVTFRFSSASDRAKFECAVRKKGKRNKAEKRLAKYRSCSSPKSYKLRKGRYTFSVRVSGQAAKPASHLFRVVRKHRR